MSSDKVNEFKNYLQGIISDNSPDILGTRVVFNDASSKKIVNFTNALKIPQNEEIIILFDDTLMGSGKEGLALTSWGLRYKITDRWDLSWKDMQEKFCNFSIEGLINKKLKLRNGQDDNYTAEKVIALTIASFDLELLKKILLYACKLFACNENKKNKENLQKDNKNNITKDIKFCSNCGYKLINGDIFCSECGNKI